jgi:Eukaryotic rRNA processing protein EBP2
MAAKNAEIGMKKAILNKMLIHKPQDYLAETLKTESQMKKIKYKIDKEKERVKKIEERKKNYESKKFSKEVKSRKQKEKSTKRKQFQQMLEKSKKTQKFDFNMKENENRFIGPKKSIKKVRKNKGN